jgi:hypothetical protein
VPSRSLRSTGPGDPPLGARDALLHGALADEERLGDLRHRQPRHDAQRERDLLRAGQVRMAAGEQQPQDVVAVVRVVQPVDERALGIVEIGQRRLVLGQRLGPLLAPDGVERHVAPDHDEPGRRIARRAVLRPRLERLEGGFLERFLGPVEIAEIAQEGRHGLGPRPCDRRVEPGEIGHRLALQSMK